MALTKDQKKAQVSNLKDALKRTKSLAFMKYRGLSVSEVDDLRGRMLEKKAKMQIAKKTLFNIASKEEGYPEIKDEIFGNEPIAFVLSFEDELSGAKIAFEFGKSNNAVELVGGVVDGRILTKDEIVEFAKILGKEELLAKFAAMLRAPLGNFASLCDSPLSAFARSVKEISDKKESGAS